MRESIGGTWLFSIVVLFIALFAAFLAYSISYTRAFNVKNEIINYIERNEGFVTYAPGDRGCQDSDIKNCSIDDLLKSDNVEANILGTIKKAGYNYTAASGLDCTTVGHANPKTQEGGYCLTKYCKSDSDRDRQYYVYYKVTTFIAIKLPVVNIVMNVPISGETKSIYYDQNSYKCEQNFDGEAITH